jgi:hypothetical protein
VLETLFLLLFVFAFYTGGATYFLDRVLVARGVRELGGCGAGGGAIGEPSLKGHYYVSLRCKRRSKSGCGINRVLLF